MNSNKAKVMEFIETNFNIADVTLIDAPLVPGGIILKDKNNQSMLIYWDILKQQIAYYYE